MSTTISKQKTRKKDGVGSALATAGPLIGFAIFGVIPLLLATIVSFTELHSTNLSDMKFVGLDNYITILTNGDKSTYASYFSTIVYLINVPLCIGLALYIANLVNQTKVGQKFFRSLFFIPYVCSSVVISLVFKKLLYNVDAGILNEALAALGFERVGWLINSPWVFMVAAILMSVWKGLGWCIVLFQAALANVDNSYYEAAKIDGANSFQIFWKITWPAISPTTGYLITIKVLNSLQAMEMMILLAGSDMTPTWGNSTAWVSDTVVKHIYNMVFEKSYQYGYGLAAAAGWILAIIIFIITRINMKTQERWVNYDF